MHSHQVQIILLLLSLVLSLFLFIAAAKYAEWARVMVSGQASGNWLYVRTHSISISMLTFYSGLVFYAGSVPLLSLTFGVAHLLALHFEILPSHGPISSNTNSAIPRHAYTASPKTYLLLLLTSAAFTISWLGQASLCTACELAPILADTQGIVPAWCPQSHFRDSGSSSLPKMLASLALVKDLTSWAMVPLSAALVECARRQWQRARIASEHADNWDPGLREYDWKSGVTVAAIPNGAVVEMGNVATGRKELPMRPPPESGAVEIGMPPSRKGTFGNGGMQGVPVKSNGNVVGLDVGMSYESRF